MNILEDYFIRIAEHAIQYYEALFSFKLVTEKNRAKIPFSKLQPTMMHELLPEEVAKVSAYRDSFIKELNRSALQVVPD